MITFAAAFEDLLAALDRLEIVFLIGGSVASGTNGLPRHTNGIDILADLKRDRVGELGEALQPMFYVDDETMKQAIDLGRSFNVIHIQGAYKFDIFPIGHDRFARSELERRRYTTTRIPGLQNIEFPVASPEDTILSKLVCFRKGGEVSDRLGTTFLELSRSRPVSWTVLIFSSGPRISACAICLTRC